LVDAGLTSLSSLAAKNPRELEQIINRPPPFGNRIKDAARHTPRYRLDLQVSGCDEVIRKIFNRMTTQTL
jgi:hypothetical protein